jgi:soluble P-type ATPase
MINVEIPGEGELQIEHVVFDVNGTLAVDGILLPEVISLLKVLSEKVKIHLLTARIGICILSEEGAALETLLQADLVVPDIVSALTILNHPARLVASLRK